MYSYEDLKQQRFYKHFVDISAIPRESGNEKAVSDYIARFGRELGLAVEQDAALNVVIRKPGSLGREGELPLVLQCHIDMVCEKTPDNPHDFTRDPILPVERDGCLCAHDTTLGADNGVGAAYIMALLESRTISHPPLEAVFTTNEETGMDGMQNLDAQGLRGNRMLNLDSEGEGTVFASCAGGVRYELTLPIKQVVFEAGLRPYRLAVSGLTGGHSGIDINRERGNSLLLLARVLGALNAACPLKLSALSGGSKSNAIPRDAEAVLWLADSDVDTADALVAAEAAILAREYAISEPGLRVVLEPTEGLGFTVLDEDSVERMLSAMLLLPNGALAFHAALPGVLDFSSSLGVAVLDERTLRLTGLVRSNTNSKMEFAVSRLERLAALVGGTLSTGSSYPAWEFRMDSPLRTACLDAYRARYGTEMQVASIHGGLECALMAGKRPDMDMVSIGPNLHDPHTPQERVEIASLLRVWEYVIDLLETV